MGCVILVTTLWCSVASSHLHALTQSQRYQDITQKPMVRRRQYRDPFGLSLFFALQEGQLITLPKVVCFSRKAFQWGSNLKSVMYSLSKSAKVTWFTSLHTSVSTIGSCWCKRAGLVQLFFFLPYNTIHKEKGNLKKWLKSKDSDNEFSGNAGISWGRITYSNWARAGAWVLQSRLNREFSSHHHSSPSQKADKPLEDEA